MPMKEKDITGKKYGLLIASHFHSKVGRIIYWSFNCDCGNKNVVKNKSSVTREKRRKGYPAHCGCLNLLSKALTLPNDEAAFNAVFAQYKASALRRNLDFTLTKEEVSKLIKMNCFYCGSKPNRKRKNFETRHGHFICNGIDRRDNSIGYIIENSLPCCWICNDAKGAMTYEDFINMAYLISKNLDLKNKWEL